MNRLLFDRKITLCPGSKFPAKCTLISVSEAIEKLRNGFWQPFADTCASLPKNERQEWKANNAPLLVMGASLRRRDSKPENLIEHSGFICLDLDRVEDIETLKIEAAAHPSIALVCKSISGTGIFCLVHIPQCDAGTHKRYYEVLQNLFAQLFHTSVISDPIPKSIVSARYVSFDPDLYVNYDPEIFDELPPAPPPRRQPSAAYVVLNEDPTKRKILRLINEAVARGIDITSDYGNKTSGYNEWLCIGGTLAALFGESGRTYYHSLSSLSPHYSERESDVKFTDVLRKNFGARVGAFVNICKKYGLDTSTHFGEQDIPLAKRPNAPVTRKKAADESSLENGGGPVVFNVKAIQWGEPPKPIPAAPAASAPVPLAHALEMAAMTQEATPAFPVTWTTPAVDPGHFPAPADKERAEDWNAEIEALRARFEGAPVPAGPVRLSTVETVTDIPAFIAGHLAMAQANQGTNVGRPYLDRLRKYFTFLNLSPQNITACI